ncbi:MAG: ribosome biogenesis GTPase YlqF [Clostridiales bacterium]|nr:ribosome biogenesis GTPase YlqF [Clostridiales bacterium]
MEERQNAQTPVIQWYPGHMVKAKRHIAEDLSLVDIIIEVADARAPLSSINPDLCAFIQRKSHVLLLNKEDLADPQQTKAWLNEYRSQGLIPAAFNAARKQGLRQLSTAVDEAATPMRARLKARGRLPRDVRAMVIGVPNCGKSTVINALSPTAAAKTGNKPGITKGRQWVKTAMGMELLDTPGMLWPRFASYNTAFKLAVLGCISDLVYPVYQVAAGLALWLADHASDALRERYKIEKWPSSAEEIILAVGAKRGLLGVGGLVRTEDAALLLLQEFRNGKLGRFTLDRIGENG